MEHIQEEKPRGITPLRKRIAYVGTFKLFTDRRVSSFKNICVTFLKKFIIRGRK